jgi:hypothetical protein
MAGYLVVAHQTVGSAELRDRLTRIAHQDPEAAFTLLIPATDPSHLLVWEAGDPQAIAERRATEARDKLTQAGLRISGTAVGDASPLQAIEDELREHPGAHDSVILCTLPPGMSHWLGLDVASETEERLDIPVEHVVAGGPYR